MPYHRERMAQLFADHFGSPPVKILGLAADGSSRTYSRLVGTGGEAAIGASGPDPLENRAFLSFSYALRSAGLPVPAIYGEDESVGIWLLEDLGDATLFEALQVARRRTGEQFPPEIEALFRRALEILPRFQIEGGRVVDFSVAHPRPDFDEQSILWDLNYFKYHFLRLARIPFSEGPLEEDFGTLVAFLLSADATHFLHRDFQSRNIMLRGEDPWFIDYQGGRRGAQQYDVASLLYSATTGIPQEARDRLLEAYLDALELEYSLDRERWREHYRGFVLVRVMQAMGAYGYRGFFERRPRFIQSIPNAARNLEHLLAEGLPVPAPELESVFQQIVERWSDLEAKSEPKLASATPEAERTPGSGFAIRISSFSYRKGYPEEVGEHGGGFVFDCRALPNPGREVRYRTLSGLDRPVVEHLEGQSEVQGFWENTRSLVEAQVENYLNREFSSLTIAYGCTGGQHRSVYFAERLARHLTDRFPNTEVLVAHREQPNWPRGERGSG